MERKESGDVLHARGEWECWDVNIEGKLEFGWAKQLLLFIVIWKAPEGSWAPDIIISKTT